MNKIVLEFSEKLDDAHHSLGLLKNKETHFLQFKSDYKSAINAIDSIRDSFFNAQPIPSNVKDWYESKINEIKQDTLLQAVRKWRRQDFHRFEKLLIPLSTKISHLGTIFPKDGPVVMGVEGAYKIVDINTPNERRIPLGQGRTETKVGLTNQPNEHKGLPIINKDPVELLELAFDFYKNVVFDYKQMIIDYEESKKK